LDFGILILSVSVEYKTVFVYYSGESWIHVL